MNTYTDKELDELGVMGRLTLKEVFEEATPEHSDRTLYEAVDVDTGHRYALVKKDYERLKNAPPRQTESNS